jgi:hypothetical protein
MCPTGRWAKLLSAMAGKRASEEKCCNFYIKS